MIGSLSARTTWRLGIRTNSRVSAGTRLEHGARGRSRGPATLFTDIAHHHGCSADRQCALDHRKGYMMQPRIHPSPPLSLSSSLARSLSVPPPSPLFLSTPLCSPSFCLLTPLIPTRPLSLYLFLHSPLRRRLKYLHDQIERYCAESRDLWSNAGKIGSGGRRRRGEQAPRV